MGAFKKSKVNQKGKAIVTKKVEEEARDIESSGEEFSASIGKVTSDIELGEESAEEIELDGLSSEESGAEEDDQFDIGEVSTDAESDYDTDENLPKQKKKKNNDDGSESFAGALNAIVGSKLKAYDRKDPILARSKKSIKKFETDKLEAKAKRALLAEKKQLHDKYRIRNILPSATDANVREILEKERRMKKISQRGVIRLFNAILSTQIKTLKDISKEKVGKSKKEELLTEMSKENFFDLVQAAGDM